MKKVEVRELADMSAVAQEFLMGEEVEVILKKASRQQRRRILDFISGLVSLAATWNERARISTLLFRINWTRIKLLSTLLGDFPSVVRVIRTDLHFVNHQPLLGQRPISSWRVHHNTDALESCTHPTQTVFHFRNTVRLS